MSYYDGYSTNNTSFALSSKHIVDKAGNIINISSKYSQTFDGDEMDIYSPEDFLVGCEWFQSNNDSEPTSKRVRRKSVSFAGDVKEHDGQKHDTYIFEKVVVHYMKIGGMTCSSQMVCFLNTINVSLNDTETICKLKERINDFADRLVYYGSFKAIPVLPEGGGSCYKVGIVALPNIKHLIRVLETALKA